jgi:beta-galactosidase
MPKLLVALFLLLCPLAAHADPRSVVPLVAQWQFTKGDVKNAETPGFDDKQWLPVTLPHTFNAADGESANYYRGPSWYRRSFEVKAVRPDRLLIWPISTASSSSSLTTPRRLYRLWRAVSTRFAD